MKISAKTDYACRALLELALHWPNQIPLQVNEIAERQSIPIKFLVHILISLKQTGFVKSIRGKKGGYVLAKSPKDIRLNDVLMNFGGSEHSVLAHPTKQENGSAMAFIWQETNEAIAKFMKSINFDDICSRVRASGKVLSYEI